MLLMCSLLFCVLMLDGRKRATVQHGIIGKWNLNMHSEEECLCTFHELFVSTCRTLTQEAGGCRSFKGYECVDTAEELL